MAVEIKDETLKQEATLIIPRREIGGWMAWVKPLDAAWYQMHPAGPKLNWINTPGSLFETREDAIKQAAAWALEVSELKLFYVELEK